MPRTLVRPALVRFALVPFAVAGLVAGPALADGDALEVSGESVRTGSLRSRLSDTRADVVLLYGSEQEGELGTCGCAEYPRGSLARVDTYREAVERAGTPALLLNAGGYLDTIPGEGDRLRADVTVRDRYMLEGLSLGGWDALNLGFRDLPYQGREGLSPLAVSANVRGPDAPTHRIFDVGGLRVAVTGVSPLRLGHMQPDGWTFDDPVASLERLVPTLEADLVVVLAYEVGALAPRLASVEGVDVLIEAGAFQARYEPFLEGDAVWVRTRARTEQLGELRLVVEDGRVISAVDRKIDMDPAIASSGPLRRLERRARRDVRRALVEIYGDLVK